MSHFFLDSAIFRPSKLKLSSALSMKFIGMICYFAGFEILRRRENKTGKIDDQLESRDIDDDNKESLQKEDNITPNEADTELEKACNMSLASTSL